MRWMRARIVSMCVVNVMFGDVRMQRSKHACDVVLAVRVCDGVRTGVYAGCAGCMSGLHACM